MSHGRRACRPSSTLSSSSRSLSWSRSTSDSSTSSSRTASAASSNRCRSSRRRRFRSTRALMRSRRLPSAQAPHNNHMKQTYGTDRQWYAVHTYSGYEDAVARNLKQRIESFGMADKIFDVVVPTEKKIKIKNGKKTEVKEKTFPGYVLVDMIATDDAWSVVRNTPQVTGFVGTANQAVPLS